MTTVAVIGSGAWGTALACQAMRAGHSVKMWALEAEVVEQINAQHVNALYLPDARLPEGIRASSDVAEAVRGADVVILRTALQVPARRFDGGRAHPADRRAGGRRHQGQKIGPTKGVSARISS